MEFKPKHTIGNMEKFHKSREKFGGIIQEGMKATGGTDIDWMVEHNGGFILLEFKEFSTGSIGIKAGQWIAFRELYKKLLPKCHFFIFGYDEDMDIKNPDSVFYYLDVKDMKDGKIQTYYNDHFKTYYFSRDWMTPITIGKFRDLIEKYWKEFENS